MRFRCTVVPPVSRETSRIGVGKATSRVTPVIQFICKKVSIGRSKGAVTASRRSAASRETTCPIARSGGECGLMQRRVAPPRQDSACQARGRRPA